MIKLLKSRKGIAPFTLIAFLVCMVAAVVFSAYLWENVVVRVGNAIQIQHVLFKSSETIIYVQNVGEGPVTLANVYIDDEKFDVNDGNCVVNHQKTNIIPKGNTAGITIVRAYTNEIHVQVVCLDGTGHESDYKPTL